MKKTLQELIDSGMDIAGINLTGTETFEMVEFDNPFRNWWEFWKPRKVTVPTFSKKDNDEE